MRITKRKHYTEFGAPVCGVVEKVIPTLMNFSGRGGSNVEFGYVRVSLPLIPSLERPLELLDERLARRA